MSQDCKTECTFYIHCRDVVSSHIDKHRNPIARRLGFYAATDRRVEAAEDLMLIGEQMCSSDNPVRQQDCMIVAAAAVKSAINNS